MRLKLKELTMNKAIKELQKYKNILLNEAAIGSYISDTKNIDEALVELQAYEAKFQKLEARVEKMKCCENCNFYPSETQIL